MNRLIDIYGPRRCLTALLVGPLALMLGATSVASQTITVGPPADLSVTPGEQIEVPIEVDLSGAQGLTLASLQFDLTWDPDLLGYVSATGSAPSGWTVNLNDTQAGSGVLLASLFSATGATESFVAVTLVFQAADENGHWCCVNVDVGAAADDLANDLGQYINERSLPVCVGIAGMMGDATDDGTVNIIDAQQVARYSIGLPTPNAPKIEDVCDATEDGACNIIDAQQIARYSIGLPTPNAPQLGAPLSGCEGDPITCPRPPTSTTPLYLRFESGGTMPGYLATEPQSDDVVIAFGNGTMAWQATLQDDIAGSTYGLALWLGVYGGTSKDYRVELVVEHDGSETTLAETTLTADTPAGSSECELVTATVNGLAGGVAGDKAIVRVTGLGDYEARLCMTPEEASHVTVPGVVSVAYNAPPTATILSPADDATYYEGEPITFSGTGEDPEDGTLTGDALTWTSNFDGQIGTGQSFTRDDLSAGYQNIWLTVEDSQGRRDRELVLIRVEEPGTIEPGDWQATAGFGGFEFTVNDQSSAITWITYTFDSYTCGGATLSGSVGISGSWPITDRRFTIENSVSANTYTVNGEFDATGRQASGTWSLTLSGSTCTGDWQGEWGTDGPPTATITSPADGSTYSSGESIAFAGSATDPEDGALTGSALVWTSSLDGQIGTGTSFNRSDLSTGDHTIVLTAEDSHGGIGADTVTITIGAPLVSGQWRAATGFGQFAIAVNPEGTEITQITYNIYQWTCGLSGGDYWYGSVTETGAWPITGSARQFTIESFLTPDLSLAVSGAFEGGNSASGTWTGVSYGETCPGTWQGEPATKLFLRYDGVTTLYLSNQQDPSTTWRSRRSSGSAAEYSATLDDALTGDQYAFWFWLRADSGGVSGGDFDVALVVDHDGSETTLASTTITVPADDYVEPFLDTVTGVSAGVPGDQLVLRITYSGSGMGEILYGHGYDSHVVLTDHIGVSMPAAAAVAAFRSQAGAVAIDYAPRGIRRLQLKQVPRR